MFRVVADIIFRRPRSMDSAPRDGTHIIALLSVESRKATEWREVYWNPFDGLWHASDPTESYADDVPKAWLPLPR
jgi:hypothetical protein